MQRRLFTWWKGWSRMAHFWGHWLQTPRLFPRRVSCSVRGRAPWAVTPAPLLTPTPTTRTTSAARRRTAAKVGTLPSPGGPEHGRARPQELPGHRLLSLAQPGSWPPVPLKVTWWSKWRLTTEWVKPPSAKLRCFGFFSSTVRILITCFCFFLHWLMWWTPSCSLVPRNRLFSSVQFCSVVSDSVTPWTAARQASLSITNSWSSLKLMAIESVMPSSHLILCRPLLFLPSNFPSIGVFSNESVLCIRWPEYWSFSFSISPSKGHPGLISFRMDWLDLLAISN